MRVRGRVERFRDELSLDVGTIARAADADPADFLPVAYRDLEELEESIAAPKAPAAAATSAVETPDEAHTAPAASQESE